MSRPRARRRRDRAGTSRPTLAQTPRRGPLPPSRRSRARSGPRPRTARRTRSSAGTRPGRRAPSRHEVDPDGLAAQGREVDRAPADLRQDQGGAGSPTWNWPSRPLRLAARGSRRRVGRAAKRTGSGWGSLGRRRDGVWRSIGSGMNATTPASRTTAVATPTSRPATIDDRGPKRDTHARVPVRAVEGGLRGPLLPCRSHGRSREPHRIRLLPALLTALGVAGLAGGVLSLTSPVVAEPLPSASPTVVASGEPTTTPLITFPPIPTEVAPSISPSRRSIASQPGSGSLRWTSTSRS